MDKGNFEFKEQEKKQDWTFMTDLISEKNEVINKSQN